MNKPRTRIVFIGDSIIQEMPISQITPHGVNYGIAGDTTKGLIDRLDTISLLNNAAAIVTLIGINDFWFYGKEKIIDYYKLLLDIMPQKTKVIINSILPIDNGYDSLPNNDSIDNVNSHIEQLCDLHTRFYYCDSNSHLKNSAGILDRDYHTGDGLHLSETGYAILMQSIALKLKAILPEQTDISIPQQCINL